MEKHSVGSLLAHAVPTAQLETERIRNESTRRVALGGAPASMVSRIRPAVLPQPKVEESAGEQRAGDARRRPLRRPTRAHCPHPTASVPASQRPAIESGVLPSTSPSTERSACPASTPA